MRYKCIVSYDGNAFHGFQRQDYLRTVEGELIKAISKVRHFDEIVICGSGRTDAGVHALGQVFHFDISWENMSEDSLKKAINTFLPSDIYIRSVEKVDDTFHARFSAHKKEYHYLVDLGEYNPLLRNYRSYYFYKNIDIEKVIEASKIFIGEHDFKAFSKSNAKYNSTIRTIDDIKIEVVDKLITFKFIGNGFLHNQIRIIVAMLLEVGRSKITKEDLVEILNSKDRKRAPKVMSPNGLYLVKVYY